MNGYKLADAIAKINDNINLAVTCFCHCFLSVINDSYVFFSHIAFIHYANDTEFVKRVGIGEAPYPRQALDYGM